MTPGIGANGATVSSQWLYRLPQPRPHLWYYFFRHRYQLAPIGATAPFSDLMVSRKDVLVIVYIVLVSHSNQNYGITLLYPLQIDWTYLIIESSSSGLGGCRWDDSNFGFGDALGELALSTGTSKTPLGIIPGPHRQEDVIAWCRPMSGRMPKAPFAVYPQPKCVCACRE